MNENTTKKSTETQKWDFDVPTTQELSLSQSTQSTDDSENLPVICGKSLFEEMAKKTCEKYDGQIEILIYYRCRCLICRFIEDENAVTWEDFLNNS